MADRNVCKALHHHVFVVDLDGHRRSWVFGCGKPL